MDDKGMAATTISSRLPHPQSEGGFLAEQGPGFIPADMHRDDLAKKREDAMQAADFHRRKLAESEAVIVSIDSALGALKEQLGVVDAPAIRSSY